MEPTTMVFIIAILALAGVVAMPFVQDYRNQLKEANLQKEREAFVETIKDEREKFNELFEKMIKQKDKERDAIIKEAFGLLICKSYTEFTTNIKRRDEKEGESPVEIADIQVAGLQGIESIEGIRRHWAHLARRYQPGENPDEDRERMIQREEDLKTAEK